MKKVNLIELSNIFKELQLKQEEIDSNSEKQETIEELSKMNSKISEKKKDLVGTSPNDKTLNIIRTIKGKKDSLNFSIPSNDSIKNKAIVSKRFKTITERLNEFYSKKDNLVLTQASPDVVKLVNKKDSISKKKVEIELKPELINNFELKPDEQAIKKKKEKLLINDHLTSFVNNMSLHLSSIYLNLDKPNFVSNFMNVC